MSGSAGRIVALNERHALAWAARRGCAPGEGDWLARFAALMPAHARVLDVGCGSGDPIARTLIGAGCSVTGVDGAPAMVDMCRAKFPGEAWLVADMRGLALGCRFDGVLACDSFFHLQPDEQPAMFAVFRAHLGVGGVLMFTSGVSHGQAIGCFCGEALYHGSLDSAEYRRLLAGCGFSVVAHGVGDSTCGGRNVWLARVA